MNKKNNSTSQSIKPEILPETPTADVFVISCRQLAYEKEMLDIVDMIDYKQGRSRRGPRHTPRLLRSPNKRLKEAGILIDRPKSTYVNSYDFRASKSRLSHVSHGVSPMPTRGLSSATTYHQQRPITSKRENNSLLLPTDFGRDSVTPVCRDIENRSPDNLLLDRYIRQVRTTSRKSKSKKDQHNTLHNSSSNHIYATKTSMTRQNLHLTPENLRLRHTELDVPAVPRSKISMGDNYRFEHDLNTSTKKLAFSNTCSTSGNRIQYTSYGHHLPNRHKSYVSQGINRC